MQNQYILDGKGTMDAEYVAVTSEFPWRVSVPTAIPIMMLLVFVTVS